MTPQIHQMPHVRASFSLNGLVQIRANDPCEGQPALVDIYSLSDLMEQHVINLKKKIETNEANNLIDSDDIYNLNYQNSVINDEDDERDDNEPSNEMINEILFNYRLMQEFPGPLVREHTSKAQIIQFCQKKVKDCLNGEAGVSSVSLLNLIDPQSHALLWDYLALLVRQNGIVDLKTDISPLLLSGIADVIIFVLNFDFNNQ
jgi:hypothetical protein